MKVYELVRNPAIMPTCEAMLTFQTRAFWYGRGRPQNPEGRIIAAVLRNTRLTVRPSVKNTPVYIS